MVWPKYLRKKTIEIKSIKIKKRGIYIYATIEGIRKVVKTKMNDNAVTNANERIIGTSA